MANILVVDDEPEIVAIIKRALELDGHAVSGYVGTAEIDIGNMGHFDLALLDIMMPGEDGYQFCERIRNKVDIPIVFLSAKVLEEDITHGLEIGADDYIVKPFRVAELRARVKAHLRREHREKTHFLNFESCSLDLDAKRLLVADREVPLTKTEYSVCEYLAKHPGMVFSKEQIFEEVFGLDKDSDSTTISTHVANIRTKLDKVGIAPITTVWGTGYKWN
ncbi:MAG: response regulator transcription factor [Lachnospiraceae bacterium]|nr:response regulator transcription factor [Lachnospiraceae bacterium]